MTAEMIIGELARLNVTLNIRNGQIWARPVSAVTPELAEAVRAQKAEVLDYLESRGHDARESAVMAQIDTQRADRDRLNRRGYDYDCSAPGHRDYLERTGRRCICLTLTAEKNGTPADSRHPLIDAEVRAKIEAVEAEARTKGWPAELLWNNAFWDFPRGLAAVLDAGDAIAEVTHHYIVILKSRRDVLRFPRHAG